MPLLSIYKFVNWITGTPVPIEDGVVSAFTNPLQAEIAALFAGGGPLSPAFNCQLQFVSTSSITLFPFSGASIFVQATAGVGNYAIPSGGLNMTNGGLSTSTFYYIYATYQGALTLSATTTGYVIDPTYGYATMSGDITHTLVGAVYVDSGGLFQDSNGTIYVLSYYNRRKKSSKTLFSANRSTNSASFVEINTEIRNQFINWSTEPVPYVFTGGVFTTSGTSSTFTTVGFNGTTPEFEGSVATSAVTIEQNAAFAGTKRSTLLTENVLNYITLLGANTSGPGDSSTWLGSAGAPAAQLGIVIYG